MRVASRMRPEGRGKLPTLIAATSADALVWTWAGGAVTSWRIKWGTASGVYTTTEDVADPNARAHMFADFLTTSGAYYIVVYGVDAGGEGDHTDEVAISYTA